MTSNAIDFFATLGRKPGQFCCKSFKNLWSDDGSMLTPNEIWNDAITDIAVLTKGDNHVDESWTVLNTSLDGEELQLPYIAIKRRATTHRLDHITKIRLVQPGEPTPVGFELLRNSISGAESSLLRQLGYLAIKRADTSSVMFIQGEPMIDDICCLMRPGTAEELPTGYVMVEKTAYPNNATAAAAAAGQPYFALGYHVRSPVGLCDLRYESATLDRYPAQDYKGLELPVNELPMFAFPNDLRLTYGSLNRFPLPVFFTFVFTDANGGHLYAACLRFYEVVPYADLLPVFNEVYGGSAHEQLSSIQKFEVLPGSEIFCPKVICVVSKRPFYRAMRRFLRQIYSLSLSFLSCPLEYFITSLVNQVPLPVEGGRTFHVMLDSALISPTSRPMAPIVFELPVARFFPHMDLDFAGPLRCLSIDNLLTVFTLMLREAKLLFVCSSNTLLTDAMESLRMLLFPMTWASCFVSRLPDALTGLLEAPGGFMVGIHVMEDNADSDKRPGSSKSPDWHLTATKNFVKTIHQSHTLIPGTYVVDLSANCLYQYDGKSTEPLSAHHMDLITKTLPLGPKQRLKLKLQKIASEYRIGPQTVGFEEFDSAFDFQSQDDSQVTAKKWEEFPTLEVRDCFMAFMIDLLGNYTKYIIPPIEDMTVDTYRTFKEEFSVSDYLEDSDPGSKHCLELLMESQMFAVLLQERSEGNHYSVVFFEQCSNLLRQLGLSAGGHGNGHSKGPNVIPELPAPIFELLEAESRWSALSKIMQQQILNTSMFSANTSSAHPNNSRQHGGNPPSTPTPHPHSLSMITLTTSSISPLRSSTPVKVVQPVMNEKLSDLLTMHKIMKSIDVFKHVALDDVGNNALLSIARQELDRKEELQLQNYDMGPLIIPGPVLKLTRSTSGRAVSDSIKSNGSQMSEADDTSSGAGSTNGDDETEKVTFSYATWPDFKKELFDAAQENIHPRLKEVRAVRLYANEKMNKRMLMFIRSPSERLAFEHQGKLHNKIKLDAHEEVSAIISGILDVASISMMMLAGRVLHLTRPAADVLQMLGIVAQIESVGLTHCMNESVWRSLLACCAAGGGDLMRRIACVVFEGINSVNFNPDALTYGQYIQALASKKINKPALPKGAAASAAVEGPEDLLLDQYLYLEEIGHTWFMQRTALIEKAQVEQEYASVMGGSVSPVAMFQKSMGSSNHSSHTSGTSSSRRQSWIMSSGNSPLGLDNVNSKRIVVKGSTNAAQYTADQLQLRKAFGLFSFLRPPELLGATGLRAVSTLLKNGDDAAEELGTEVMSRLETFYSLAAAAAPSQVGKRRMSLDALARNASRESSLTAPSTITTASHGSSSSSAAAVASSSAASHHVNVASPERRPPPALSSSANHHTPVNDHSPFNMMSRMGSQIMGAASSVASTVKPLASSSSAENGGGGGGGGWSITKRFFTSSKSSNSSSGTQYTPPPPSSSNAAAIAPPPTPPAPDAKGVITHQVDDESTGLRGSFLKFMPSTLNFDDEEGSDEEEDNDSQPSTDAAAPATPVDPTAAADTEASTADAVVESESKVVPSAEPSTVTAEAKHEESGHQIAPIADPLATHDKDAAEAAAVEEAFTRASLVEEEQLHPTKKMNVSELQSKLLKSFERDIKLSGSVVGIHSRSECLCGYAMLDEEVLGMWCKFQSEDIHTSVVLNSSSGVASASTKKGDSRARLDRALSVGTVMKNLLAAHAILCPQCGSEFTPILNVHQYSLDSTAEDHQERARPYSKYVVSTWSTTVNHMSPFALRFELEEVVLKFGETVCEADWLHSHYPDLYWGVVWYANRFGVPTGFLNSAAAAVAAGDHLLDNAVVVGWSSNAVKVKAFKLLTGQVGVQDAMDTHLFHHHQSETYAGVVGLELVDIFPQLSQEEVVILTELVEDKLDGSPAGMRAAMLELSRCKNLFVEAKDTQKKGQSTARIIYLTLLSLSYLFNKTKLIGNPIGPDVVRILTRDFAFDKLFMDTISWTLSRADFVEMKTTENELVKCVATKEVQAARIGFGFQF